MTGDQSAGRGDPYWYEWFVGLIEVVALFDPTAKIESVAFQVEGLNGWDDVIVSLRDGRRRCYQIKHTRAGNTLSFGDMVQTGENNISLIRSLFGCWRDAGLNDGKTSCILYTNREAGNRWSTTASGNRRPPLLAFSEWLASAVCSISSLADLNPRGEFADGWLEWNRELDEGTDAERLGFMKALTIRAKQDDLPGLGHQLRARLADAFGIDDRRVAPLFDSLCRALIKWTTGHVAVTVEDVCAELVIEPQPEGLALAPPPPAPFFPTRVPIADDLERLLKSRAAKPVIFLTGEPGAGKTSVVSWLANRRDDQPFKGLVGARFYCFEPIRPESPIVAPDASRVRPEDLWLTLLVQLRSGLGGRLHELQVPLRNDFLSWADAREHVLRLCNIVGAEQDKRFVIVIDGIDHAARAVQTMPHQTADFFRSLPGPDELQRTHIQLLIAGQPPEYYREQYPTWLCGNHPNVDRIDLRRLKTDDVRELYIASRSSLPGDQTDAAVRVIEESALGNTLATVFAVAEAETCTSTELLQQRLKDRRLAHGLEAYYAEIWRHMLQAAGNHAVGLDSCLAGTFSMARSGILAEHLAATFCEWGEPVPWWRALLQSLGPLLIDGAGGARVRHNAVRVFLTARFASCPPAARRDTASRLADYHRDESSDRLTTHLQLFDLLNLAGRGFEAGNVFNVEWVLEGTACGIDTAQLTAEARAAVLSLPHLRSWRSVVFVACAIQTLDRVSHAREYSESVAPAERQLPAFFATESRVEPLAMWKVGDLNTLVGDVVSLLTFGERARAQSLLERWLGGMHLGQLVEMLPDAISDEHALATDREKRLGQSALRLFEELGRLCGVLSWRFPIGDGKSQLKIQARVAFERGFIKSIDGNADAKSVRELFTLYEPRYISNWIQALRRLVDCDRWDLVREILEAMSGFREKIDANLRCEITWWAIRSGAAADSANWLDPLDLPRFGLESSGRREEFFNDEEQPFAALLNVARSIGWTRVGLDPGDIAEIVVGIIDFPESRQMHKAPTVLLLRAAAQLGKLAAVAAGRGIEQARDVITPRMVRQILLALWGLRDCAGRSFRHYGIGAQLASELSDICARMSGEHEAAVVESAVHFANQFPVDYRMDGLWTTVARAGKRDLLRRWLHHWLDEDGEAWHLSRDEVHSVVHSLAEHSASIGETALASAAEERLRWLPFGYHSRKEYGFQEVFDWFTETSKRLPSIWSDSGWKLWCICRECDLQGGDNRLEPDILNAVSAAAIRCGASAWWSLISTTLGESESTGWHDDLRARIVDGTVVALDHGAPIPRDDLMVIWCIAISFSFWTDSSDTGSLRTLRDAIVRSAGDNGGDVEAQLQRICQRAFANSDPDGQETEMESDSCRPSQHADESTNISQILERIDRGEFVGVREAANAIDRICSQKPTKHTETVSRILRSIGTCSSYASDLNHVESLDEPLVQSIVKLVGDAELWCIVEAFGRDIEYATSWTNGVQNNLLLVARLRAAYRDGDALKDGLSIQIETHARWAFGNANGIETQWPYLNPQMNLFSWRDVALSLITILMQSYSSEVLAAAIEGMHCLVALDQAAEPLLFERLESPWARRWLLIAAESWATLHPDAIREIHDELVEILRTGQFEQKLQSWIVLCRYSDTICAKRPRFPIPATAAGSGSQPTSEGILEIPPVHFGRHELVDRNAAAVSKLSRLSYFGFNFRPLSGIIASKLTSIAGATHQGPHRRNPFTCTPLDSEKVVGDAIDSILAADWLDEQLIPLLAQGFLSNEDAWLQRCPPRPASARIEWPNREYGTNSIGPEATRDALVEIAMNGDVPKGWITIAAKVVDYSWKEDFAAYVWWEDLGDGLTIRAPSVPMCLGGRSFAWWLGKVVQPTTTEDQFVSGLFVGGTQRLCNCGFEIQPPSSWYEGMGWRPDPNDALRWYSGPIWVAQYDRMHGPLRNNPHGPSYRQPVCERWLVTQHAFLELKARFGELRHRVDFKSHPFED